MNKILSVLMTLFCIIATVSVFAALIYLVCSLYKMHKEAKHAAANRIFSSCEGNSLGDTPEMHIENALQTLKSNTSPREAASAFGILVKFSYILIHILQNKGNHYNDAIQTRIYQDSLSQQCVDALLNLEEHHGGYWI